MTDPTRAALERLIELEARYAAQGADPDMAEWDNAIAAAHAALAAEESGEAGAPATRRACLWSPTQMAECGGPCWKAQDPSACDCGALWVDVPARPTVPPAPLEGEVGELVKWLRSRAGIPASPDFPAVAAYLTRAADLLAQLSAAAPAVVPVAVSERLPGAEDCDAEGRCWWSAPETDERWGNWCLAWGSCLPPEDFGATHWLPAHTLPPPAPQGGEGVQS